MPYMVVGPLADHRESLQTDLGNPYDRVCQTIAVPVHSDLTAIAPAYQDTNHLRLKKTSADLPVGSVTINRNDMGTAADNSVAEASCEANATVPCK